MYAFLYECVRKQETKYASKHVRAGRMADTLEAFGVDAEGARRIFLLCAAVLAMGNLAVAPRGGGSEALAVTDAPLLETVAELLQVKPSLTFLLASLLP